MMNKVRYILPLVFLVVFGCREPFDFDYADVINPRVVIDGFITNEGRSHIVRVSNSTTFNSRGLTVPRFIIDADVRITDDQNNFTILTHTRNGIYVSAPQYAAEEGRSYTLTVTLATGEVYESTVKTLPPPSPAQPVIDFPGDTREVLVNNGIVSNTVSEERGAAISATLQKDGNRHFYQWLISHYFIIEAAQAPDELKFCYLRDIDQPRVVLFQDNPAQEGGPTEFTYDIDFIPLTSKMQFDFGVEGRLLTLNEEDFTFWDLVRRQIENTGGLFDAAPSTIPGNITNRATGEGALGYFGVYRETTARTFFQVLELGLGGINYNQCMIQPFAQRPDPCEDCRLYEFNGNFGTTPPIWWRN